MDFVRSYCKRIGYTKSPEEYVRENKKFVTVKAVNFIKIQMKEKTFLGHDGIFVTEEEYSEFVRTEIVVNAAVHRDYGIKGTDIQIKMFDDRLEVDSPGSFAGMVKKENIRYTHFSRNPIIAAFLKDYGYVKEYGEGVDQMCKELEAIGLPDPVFNNDNFILKTTVMSADRNQRKTENARIGSENAKIESKNAKIESKNAKIESEKVRIDTSISWIAAKNARIEQIKNLYENRVMTAITSSAIIAVLEDLRENQVIGTLDVQKILDCKGTKAFRIITEMKKADVIVAVNGQGKGKYILNMP